jgi:hypothetical protein
VVAVAVVVLVVGALVAVAEQVVYCMEPLPKIVLHLELIILSLVQAVEEE